MDTVKGETVTLGQVPKTKEWTRSDEEEAKSLGRDIAEALGTKVFLRNDAEAATRGVMALQMYLHENGTYLIALGTGFGAKVFFKNRILAGPMEGGHMVTRFGESGNPDDTEFITGIGQNGASGIQLLAKNAGFRYPPGQEGIVKTIGDAAADGDAKAQDILKTVGHAVADNIIEMHELFELLRKSGNRDIPKINKAVFAGGVAIGNLGSQIIGFAQQRLEEKGYADKISAHRFSDPTVTLSDLGAFGAAKAAQQLLAEVPVSASRLAIGARIVPGDISASADRALIKSFTRPTSAESLRKAHVLKADTFDRPYTHADFQVDALASKNKASLEALALELADKFSPEELARIVPILFGERAYRFQILVKNNTVSFVLVEKDRVTPIVDPIENWRNKLTVLRRDKTTHREQTAQGLLALLSIEVLKADMQPKDPSVLKAVREGIAHELPLAPLAAIENLEFFSVQARFLIADIQKSRHHTLLKNDKFYLDGRFRPDQKAELLKLVQEAKAASFLFLGSAAEHGETGVTALYVDTEDLQSPALSSNEFAIPVSGLSEAAKNKALLSWYPAILSAALSGSAVLRHFNKDTHTIERQNITLTDLEAAFSVFRSRANNKNLSPDIYLGILFLKGAFREYGLYLPITPADINAAISASRMAWRVLEGSV